VVTELYNFYTELIIIDTFDKKYLYLLTTAPYMSGRELIERCDKTSIQLDDSAVRAFNERLVQLDYNKKFTLTTDASDLAIGAVLSQEGKPITFSSKTLTKAEQIYATNKKAIAIVWAFKNLRNYLYGVNNIKIYI